MGLSVGVLIQALLFVGGIFWCKAIWGKLPHQFDRLRRAKDPAERIAIALLWLVTALVVAWMAGFVWGLVRSFLSAF